MKCNECDNEREVWVIPDDGSMIPDRSKKIPLCRDCYTLYKMNEYYS